MWSVHGLIIFYVVWMDIYISDRLAESTNSMSNIFVDTPVSAIEIHSTYISFEFSMVSRANDSKTPLEVNL